MNPKIYYDNFLIFRVFLGLLSGVLLSKFQKCYESVDPLFPEAVLPAEPAGGAAGHLPPLLRAARRGEVPQEGGDGGGDAEEDRGDQGSPYHCVRLEP